MIGGIERLPSGGPLALSENVARLFIAQIEVWCSVPDSPAEDAAWARVRAAAAALSDDDKANAVSIAESVLRLLIQAM